MKKSVVVACWIVVFLSPLTASAMDIEYSPRSIKLTNLPSASSRPPANRHETGYVQRFG